MSDVDASERIDEDRPAGAGPNLPTVSIVGLSAVAVAVSARIGAGWSVHATVVATLVGAGAGSLLTWLRETDSTSIDRGRREPTGGWFHPLAAAIAFALTAAVAATWIFALGTVRAGYGAAFAFGSMGYALAASNLDRR